MDRCDAAGDVRCAAASRRMQLKQTKWAAEVEVIVIADRFARHDGITEQLAGLAQPPPRRRDDRLRPSWYSAMTAVMIDDPPGASPRMLAAMPQSKSVETVTSTVVQNTNNCSLPIKRGMLPDLRTAELVLGVNHDRPQSAQAASG